MPELEPSGPDADRRPLKFRKRRKSKTAVQDDDASDGDDEAETEEKVDIKCTVTCTCERDRKGFRCEYARTNWAEIVWPLRLRLLQGTADARWMVLVRYMLPPPAGRRKRRKRKSCKECVPGQCEGHVVKPQHQYNLPGQPPQPYTRVCRKMFVAATRPWISADAIKVVHRGMRTGESLMPKKRGGATREVPLWRLSEFYDYVNERVPREHSHYTLGLRHNDDQVVLEAHWCPSKIYWEYMKEKDPEYYKQQLHIKRLRSRNLELDEDVIRLKPLFSLTVARRYLKRLCFRVGKDHKDRCATCYKHELHIKLGRDVRATKKVRKTARSHAAAKKIHLERGWRAYEVCAQERELCLDQNEEQRSTPPVECTCGLPVDRCKCLYNTREGFAHMQMDKGSKLGLPQFHVNLLWYKSRMWILVEHVTDTSQDGRGRRTAHMWQEVTGAGGSANMISVLWYHLTHNPSGRKGLTLWLDNCWHELKNWDMVFFLVWLVVVVGMFEWIEVKYYESGHSYMGGYGPDSTHSKITRAGKLVDRKVVAEDWYKIARECNNGEITVVEFDAEYHRDWNGFLGQWFMVETAKHPSTMKVDTDGNRACLPDYRYLRIEGGMYAGLLQAWEEVDPTSERVLIRTLKKNLHYHYKVPKTYEDDIRAPCWNLEPAAVRLNGVKGCLAGFEFMAPWQIAEWRKTLVGVKVQGDLRNGNNPVGLDTPRTEEELKEKVSVLTESRYDELVLRITQDDTEEEPSDDPRSGSEKRQKERKRVLKANRKKRRTKATQASRAAAAILSGKPAVARGRPRKSARPGVIPAQGPKRKPGRPPKAPKNNGVASLTSVVTRKRTRSSGATKKK